MYIIFKLRYRKQANIYENIDYILVFKFGDMFTNFKFKQSAIV